VSDPADRIRELEAQLAERDERIAKLEAMVEKLRELLERNSSNSSMPPSTDRGKNPKRNAKKGKKRGKRGAKKGHKGSHRALLPPDKVDETHEHFPAACKGCGRALDAEAHGDPERHQVTEIPPLRAHTTEHRLHSVECACGCVTKADLPEGVTRGAFGPTLVSFVALLTGVYRLSKRGCADALKTLFGIEMSTGSVSRCEKEVSDAVKATHSEAAAAARQAATGYADETSWQQEAKTHWLWVLVTSVATVFLIRKGRTKEVAKELLGKFAGTC
jgi:transposase